MLTVLRDLFACDEPPTRAPSFYWAALSVWTAVVYAAIPFARRIQLFVSGSIGKVTFTIVVLIVVALAGSAAVRMTWRNREHSRTPRLAVLAVVGAAYVYGAISLRSAPEEALHFVQYGVLATLAFRALSVKYRDAGAYLAAAGVAFLVGMGDEIIQWLVPTRFFGWRDIGLNVLGAGLALVAIGAGLVPSYIEPRLRADSLRLSMGLLLAAALVFLFLVLSSPQAVESVHRSEPRASAASSMATSCRN